jgi:hypothetical protein
MGSAPYFGTGDLNGGDRPLTCGLPRLAGRHAVDLLSEKENR